MSFEKYSLIYADPAQNTGTPSATAQLPTTTEL
jgi:hypothetical protein